jgi:hypothetical protein
VVESGQEGVEPKQEGVYSGQIGVIIFFQKKIKPSFDEPLV